MDDISYPDINLYCIIKELSKLSMFYELDCHCTNERCGVGKFSISVLTSDRNDPDNDCYILTPEKCLHYMKVENKDKPICGNNNVGFIRYDRFRIDLISNISSSDFAFNPTNFTY